MDQEPSEAEKRQAFFVVKLAMLELVEEVWDHQSSCFCVSCVALLQLHADLILNGMLEEE